MRHSNPFFLQGEPASTALRLLEDRRLKAALNQLREFEVGDERPEHDSLNSNQPWGSGDTTYRCGDYMMAANHKL